jgi:MarR family transcriptional regulator for hemolysin
VLAERLEVAPITVARLVDRMEAAGWVVRKDDPSDRRASSLYLTERCAPLLAAMHERAEAMLAEALAGISPSDRRQLLDTLQRIKTNLAEAEQRAAKGEQEVEHDGRGAQRAFGQRNR